MGKSLSTLAGQLRRNHGFHLIPTFDNGIVPGTIVHRRRWNDISRVGRLVDDRAIDDEALGPVEGPTPCLLADFNRIHELSMRGALELLTPRTASARAEFRKAKEAVAMFGAPMLYTRSLILMEDAIEADPGIWDRGVGERIRSRNHYVVFQVVRARLTFLFRGSGTTAVDLQSGALKKLSSAGLGADWTWRNEATLESKKEIVVAAELARYRRKRNTLVPR